MAERFNREKFKALVHYIIWKAGDKDGFGATKLNKVLWFADARAYMLDKRSITGAQYTRGQFGPVPHQIMPTRKKLLDEGLIKEWDDEYAAGRRRTCFKALVPPDQSAFTNEELKNINFWIDYVQGKTAAEISEESHDYGWEIAEMGEALPFQALFAQRIRDPEGPAEEWVKKRIKELGLQ